MLKWEIKNNIISELYYNDLNVIYPWGLETADSSAFFSLEKGVGWRNQKLFEKYDYDETNYQAQILTNMREGKWNLLIEDYIQENIVYRSAQAITLEDSFFMDFVMRFRFKKEFIEYVKISDKKYVHKNSNVYYQFETDNVFIKGKGFKAKVKLIENITPNNMIPVMYVRDAQDEWVVHVRMIPQKCDKEVIKICTAWAKTRPLPHQISDLILRNTKIKNYLWYKGERNPFKNRIIRKFFNPAAYGIVSVPKGNLLSFKVMTEFE